MKRAPISMALAVTVAASFAPVADAANPCNPCMAEDVCCPTDTQVFCERPDPKISSNWTRQTPCCKLVNDRYECTDMKPL